MNRGNIIFKFSTTIRATREWKGGVRWKGKHRHYRQAVEWEDKSVVVPIKPGVALFEIGQQWTWGEGGKNMHKSNQINIIQ